MSALQPDDSVPGRNPEPDPDHPSSWLVGPDEGLAAEVERVESKTGPTPTPTLLRRPGAPAPEPPRPATPSQVGRVVPEPEDASALQHGLGGMQWAPGADSVPSIRRAEPSHYVPEATRDFPMDDAEERGRRGVSHDDFEDGPQPHEVVRPEAFDTSAPVVPWWMQLLHTFGADRRIQVIIGLVLVVLVTVALWPRGERPMSVGHLRRLGASMDGVQVLVSGKVGQVFPVGGGYAYYLQDGRDTLVVFTRVSHPMQRRPITVRGTMSVGYLDGVATEALFESNTPQR
jgi:hypothetical protein